MKNYTEAERGDSNADEHRATPAEGGTDVEPDESYLSVCG
jgi:hypothetical protein